ncbi:hypothetical protein BJY01DRAFT_253040 [Aspergillus pseudoustus]|uniref:Cyanovirin-N domain-containing protein n=1 Tax=Aspergillus pseudoustus TaxID=1810923 RepID=A0ABR4J3H2_9EURO
MKISALLLPAFLLPLSTLSMPVSSPNDATADLFARDKKCTITGASTVNCRAKFNTNSTIKRKLKKGSSYTFDCFVTGERVIIDGVSNASWQWSSDLQCYVNGHYTDSKCTSQALGRCAWDF